MVWGDVAIGNLGSGALVVIVVLLVLRGILVPRKTLQDVQQERDTWRQAHRVSEEARREDAQQVARLLQQSEATVQLLTALKDAAYRDGH